MLSASGSGVSPCRFEDSGGTRFARLRRLLTRGRDIAANGRAEQTSEHSCDRSGVWVGELRQRGYSLGPTLAADVVGALCRYARGQTCYRPGHSERFRIADIRGGRTPEGLPVAIADVMEPLGCPQVVGIATDPMLMETAQRFLGYAARRTRVRLFWNPVSGISDRLRRAAGHPVDFQYDVEAGTSLHLYFYLMGGSPESGAQVVIEKSNRPKSMHMVLDGASLDEQSLLGRYGRDSAIVIAGGPGVGFFEDPACFHKTLVPTHGDRLCLQIRYS